MELLEALDIQTENKAMVSLVGGGGKTSIMYRLARELKLRHRKVLVTTTTAIYYPEQSLYDRIFLWNEEGNLPAGLQSVEQGSIVVAGSRVTEENKLKGIPGEWVDQLYHDGIFDAILVEADGAKRKPVKAPDIHEPVVPAGTSILTGVIGFDCYGKKIDPLWVHRPHILSRVVGKAEGNVIDDEVILKLVSSQNGLFKSCPGAAQKVLFINKVESDEQLMAAERIGSSVLKQNPDINKVLIGSMFDKKPVQTVMERVAG